MAVKCPRCLSLNPAVANFCARCGLSLMPATGSVPVPGGVRHPDALPRPEGFLPCADAEHLHYRWGPPSGKKFLLGTEGLAVYLFNGAYPLQKVLLVVRGLDATGYVRFSVNESVARLPVGEEVRVDVPSYELPDDAAEPIDTVEVKLVSAEFVPQG